VSATDGKKISEASKTEQSGAAVMENLE